jgi:methyltransferase
VVLMVSLSVTLFIVLILATGGERIYELIVSRRNAAKAFAAGGAEHGRGHFPAMMLLHTGLLVGAIIEVAFFDRPFLGWFSWTMLAIALACQVARYWVIWALGDQWNTRIIVIPGAKRVTRGPYAIPWLRHPNYWIVAIEGFTLAMVHTAWVTAIVFTVLNALLLLGFRIPAENRALEALK